MISLDNYIDSTETSPMSVTLELCTVTDFSVRSVLIDQYYTIGSGPEVLDDNFEFVQTADCQNEETFTQIGVPSFVTTSEDESPPIIDTDDLAMADTYPITIQSEITAYVDQSGTQQTFTASFSFEFITNVFGQPFLSRHRENVSEKYLNQQKTAIFSQLKYFNTKQDYINKLMLFMSE